MRIIPSHLTVPCEPSVVLTLHCVSVLCPQPEDGCARRSGRGKERGRGAETIGQEEKKELIAKIYLNFMVKDRQLVC